MYCTGSIAAYVTDDATKGHAAPLKGFSTPICPPITYAKTATANGNAAK